MPDISLDKPHSRARSIKGNAIGDEGMRAIGKALLSDAAGSLCALQCDAFHVPLGATDLDLSSKRLGPAAATLLAGVIKGNRSISTLKWVHAQT